MSKKGGMMSITQLRRRGWTDELIAALLPRPNYICPPGLGHSLRAWKKADVLAAEGREEFAAGRTKGARPGRAAKPAAPRGSQGAAELLRESFAAAEKDDSAEWRLAALYNEGVLRRLAAASLRPLRENQAVSWINEFLALERRAGASSLTELFKHFIRAAAWLGENASSPAAERVRARYPAVLRECAARQAAEFIAQRPEADLGAFLSEPGFPAAQLVTEGLGQVWSVWYVPRAIQSSLKLLIALNPKDEFPAARAMRRHFVLHIGGTNTGKTYAGFERLARAETGVYLAPLRLLALEAQERLLDWGVNCSLSTGEEEDIREGDTHLAATAEKLEMERYFDAAVIDECQMLSDSQRGWAWTRAILGLRSPEIHLCAAPEAKNILIRIIESCSDTYEVIEHERTTPLICMQRTTDYRHVQPGDALITFSKVGVLSVAEDLRQSGREPAIIYGALPYATRRRQMEGFLNGDMEYIVSTDAIGMGLNLPIRRIIFMETEKYDGVERRQLRPEEIKQIAGRAGRRGMYPRGYVGATENLELIRAGLEAVVPPIQYASVGFSDLVLKVDFDLLEVLGEWNKLPTVEPYRKMDITRYITVIGKLREQGFALTKEQELRAANIPFDETEDALRELFYRFMRQWQAGEEIERPALASEQPTLPELELYYRKLDLYFSFSRAFGCAVDTAGLDEVRERVAEDINEILLHRLRSNIRFCDICGRPLPLHHHGRLCDRCYAKKQRRAEKRRQGMFSK